MEAEDLAQLAQLRFVSEALDVHPSLVFGLEVARELAWLVDR
jgi:hypothetical protein